MLEVGVFASQWSQRIEERNLLYLAPLFLIALFAWIERGQPRPPRAAVAAAVVAAALPGTIPFLGLMNINAQSDTPFIYPWWYLGDRVVGRANVALVAVAVSVALAAGFLWLSRRHAPVLPVLVAVGFFVTWLPLQLWNHSFANLSSASYSTGITAERGWIDHAVGRDADVTLIWTGDNPYRGWENEFWNRSLRHVYDLGASPLLAGGREPRLTIQKSSGILLDRSHKPVHAEYVLADSTTEIVGTTIVADQGRKMTLYRVHGLVRTATVIAGWQPDLWTGPTVDWTRHACTRGVLRVPVKSDPVLFAGVIQRIAVSGTTTAPFVVRLPSNRARTITVPLRPRHGVCHVHFEISPTRRPVSYPVLNNPDSRLLGVLVNGFRYAPSPGP